MLSVGAKGEDDSASESHWTILFYGAADNSCK